MYEAVQVYEVELLAGDVLQSWDPNEIAGMTGFGDTATQRYVKPGEWLDYTVYFENKSTAATAAQEVIVTSDLSEYLDWGTLELGEIAFNNQVQLELKGKRRGTATVPQAGTSQHVKMTASLDESTGRFELYLRSWDKSRQAYGYWPESVYAGFLPPNNDEHVGEGHFTLRVKVRDDAPDGVMIPASATIVFDQNEPITTSPAWFNWVNSGEVTEQSGYLTWDAVEGGSYVVTLWTGDPELENEKAVVVTTTHALDENRWRIPAGLADGTLYFWQVTTTDKDGNVSKGSVYGFELGGRVIQELKRGWNLVSVPFELADFNGRQLLGQTLYTTSNNTYVQASSLETGHGYWLYHRGGGTAIDLIPANGERTVQPMELEGGWNMVGPTASDYTLDDSHTVWFFENGKWQLLDTDEDGQYRLKAGQGYWIYHRQQFQEETVE